LELSGGLFGALALQLAACTTGTSGIEQCSNCGHFFTPDPQHAPRETRAEVAKELNKLLGRSKRGSR
jgi:hypothetical protein